jgi:hypothetical protein
MQSRTKLVTVIKQWGKLTRMKAYISCLFIMERGWYIPSYYNRDSKTKKKDHQIYSKRCKTSKMDQRFNLFGNIIVKG